MIRPLGALLLALLALSACAPIESMRAELFPPEETVPPPPRRKPVAVSEPTAAEAISEPTVAEADPGQLVGLDFDAAKALLGDPAAKHEKPPAEVWAYAGGSCMFNLFFYPSVDDKVFRVLAYEVTDAAPPADASSDGAPSAVKAHDKDDPVVRRCFAELLHSKRGPDAG